MFNLILMPAHGRTYKTNREALIDWVNGKDFRLIGGGPYTSVRDASTLARHHNNVILHTDVGGVYVIRAAAVKVNPLDSIL